MQLGIVGTAIKCLYLGHNTHIAWQSQLNIKRGYKYYATSAPHRTTTVDTVRKLHDTTAYEDR